MNTKISASKKTTVAAAKPAKVSAPKEGPKKIEKVLDEKPTRDIKSFEAMKAKEGRKTVVGETKVAVGRENSAKPGTARHTAITVAQSCKTTGELYGKLAANWVNWIKKEGFITIGA